MSCFWFSLSVMVMVPLDTADVVVVPALSFDTSAIDLLHQLNGWIDIDQYIY